ncbi:MAG: transposase [Amphiplicatus sp.]
MQEILGRERRRRWSDDDKLKIVAESFRPGVSVSWVARRHGVSASQLFNWRKAARVENASIAPAADLIPVVISTARSEPPAPTRERLEESNAMSAGAGEARIEVAFPNGRRLSAPAGLDRGLLEQLIASVARG